MALIADSIGGRAFSMMIADGAKPAKVYHLGAQTLATHNLTDLLREHLRVPARRSPAGALSSQLYMCP